jgi:multidrug resistance efflux pump
MKKLNMQKVEPIFGPFLGGMLKSVLPDSATKSETKMLNKAIAEVTKNNVELLDSKSLLERFKGLNIEGVFTTEEFSELKKLILENQEQLQSKKSELNDKIIELLDKKVK